LGSRRIAIVHNEREERDHLVSLLIDAGYDAVAADSRDDVAPERLAHVGVVIIAEAALPQGDAGAFLDDLSEHEVLTPCLVIPEIVTVARAVALMSRGAFSLLTAPVEQEQLVLQVEQALRHLELRRKNARLQESLELNERLAMIGKLAAGVAHELNNPLDGVLRFVNLAADTLPPDAQQIPYLSEARRGLRRMADIVRELLQFSRNAVVESTDEDGAALAKDAVAQTIALVPHKKVDATFEFPATGVRLPRAMFQVFGNLAKNAVDAMPSGGQLHLVARYLDDQVLIDFRDDGAGIPDEIRLRIFEPFFTTKEVGQGTGLGLPICQRIVERLGGTLDLESEIGIGTTIRMTLPSETSAQSQRETSLSPAARRVADLVKRAGD